MNNEEYVRRLGQLYNEVMSLRKDEDYVVNQAQMEKFIDVLDFFRDMVSDDSDGEITDIDLAPKEENGGITATFIVFDVYGENVKRYCDVMRHCSAIGIEARLNDKICISVTVPEVFKHK